MIVDGQESKCYSVEPVLRCLPGCLPVKTMPVTIGFHCLPTGMSQMLLDGYLKTDFLVDLYICVVKSQLI